MQTEWQTVGKQCRPWSDCSSRGILIWVYTVCPDLTIWKLRIIKVHLNCDASSEFVSSSIPSWQILTAHAQPFRRARDLAFCLKVPLDSLLVWASSGGSGETARMRRLAWTFAARIGDKYQIRLTRPNSVPDPNWQDVHQSEPILALEYKICHKFWNFSCCSFCPPLKSHTGRQH